MSTAPNSATPPSTANVSPNEVIPASVQENIEVMRRWFHEVWNEGRVEAIHELFAANGVATGHYGDRSVIHGPEEFVPFYKQIRASFSNMKTTIEDAFGIGDKVAVRWTAVMTHSGDGMGVPPTGNVVKITGTTIARIADGKVIEGWDNWDRLGLLEQIGLYASPASRAA